MVDIVENKSGNVELSYFPHNSIVPSVSVIYRKFQIFLADELKKENLFPSEFPFLMAMIVIKGEGILQDDLIKLLGVTKSVATRVLQTLEEKGFIFRTESAHSKRHKLIMKTKKIQEIEPFLSSVHIKWYTTISNSLENKELDALNILLKKMATNAVDFKSS